MRRVRQDRHPASFNQGVKKSDLALSSFHAIAKQTIGGLAQGLSIEKPVVFEGGPLTFNRTLVRVFAERLDLRPEEILSPDRPELLIACGAARAAVKLFSKEEALATADGLLDRIEKVRAAREEAKKQSEAGNGDEKHQGYKCHADDSDGSESLFRFRCIHASLK